MQRLIARSLAPLQRAVGNMVARGVVVLANSASKMQTLQIRLLHDELKQDVEHFEPYGFTSKPKNGAEAVTLFLSGDRSHGVAIVVADRRYRLLNLIDGEMAIHDDLGQKVHLTRAGIVINGATLPITITNAPKVRMEIPLLEVTGEIKDKCDTTGKTMSSMRTTYNGHTHSDPQGGSVSTPSVTM